ncbi:HAD family hydrolase [Streptomyces olivochromogenes]|uniref:HAD family hydrolase n=1 Tax=Streptomyces olivochromogenes TaxID=1963 RepID=UPI001F234E9B|nr:HAD family phosphatase [Streptomyces olivochromogenes]MCF3136753.1 HAD family phosphatase [Streptomyces olivochromogenes]
MVLRHLRLVAVNIDGVLLNDTFSPVIHRFLTRRGMAYTAEIERNVLSQSRMRAAVATGVEGTPEEVVKAYFLEREEYLREHPVHVMDGAGELLERLRATGVPLVCYGGLDRSHFDRHLAEYAGYFDEPQYVCTDRFRPGVREIAENVFGLSCDQVLFIDDVARVAEVARSLGAAFIGHPTSFEHSFQDQLMREAGVRHLVRSLDGIDERMLSAIDAEAAEGLVWQQSADLTPARA